ncbi:uncharacterized protein MONBRDRAFT_35754 [Monosiga brevicollis MX1]|uniref:Uncharacterized protein n=1 Tax=Monosiga brevicollis TaxID=81824 RepID=A9UNL9_MONBE|nr:uncharacterized protein MONBRDRAFT_35754 [Monosiga brevicollis MX1]EDQ92721.1 predicted protein [Monosiga brevicollis MX1]|eukprot:XP_001742483.1 hypothetical protein [Monosiga brevicollis MX1]
MEVGTMEVDELAQRMVALLGSRQFETCLVVMEESEREICEAAVQHWSDSRGWTLLHKACAISGAAFIIQRLLDLGADFSAQTERERTPLHVACSTGQYETAQLLLDCGADLHVLDDWGSPLHTASAHGHVALVGLLLARGAAVNERDKVRGVPKPCKPDAIGSLSMWSSGQQKTPICLGVGCSGLSLMRCMEVYRTVFVPCTTLASTIIWLLWHASLKLAQKLMLQISWVAQRFFSRVEPEAGILSAFFWPIRRMSIGKTSVRLRPSILSCARCRRWMQQYLPSCTSCFSAVAV